MLTPLALRVMSLLERLNRSRDFGAIVRLLSGPAVKLNPRNFRSCGRDPSYRFRFVGPIQQLVPNGWPVLLEISFATMAKRFDRRAPVGSGASSDASWRHHHTWGQTLQHHPHVRVVPGGGPSLDGTRWVACGFFLPVRVLSLFLQELENAFGDGKLRFFTNLADLAEPQAFARRLRELQRLDWVVYAKPPFGGPEQVLAYLSRYTHRVAIANSRLLSLADGKIRFTWKDYRAEGKTKVMFIRRFLLHALTDGFHRIRHYGFLTNGSRGDSLALCRRLLDVHDTAAVSEPIASRTKPTSPSVPIAAAPCAELQSCRALPNPQPFRWTRHHSSADVHSDHLQCRWRCCPQCLAGEVVTAAGNRVDGRLRRRKQVAAGAV